MNKTIISWSGGKDSALALFFCLQSGHYDIVGLLTNVNEQFGRVSMHGVRTELIEAQARAVGLPLHKLEFPEDVSMDRYNEMMRQRLTDLKEQGITHVVYGDIFLEDLRHYREQQLHEVGLQGVFPLWNQDTRAVLSQFIQWNFKAILVCLNEKYLPESWAGRELDATVLTDFPPSADPGGENGEYHSFVYDGPIFKKSISFQKGKIVRRSYTASTEMNQWDTHFIFQDLISC